MIMRLVTVNRQPWAVGFQWEPFSSAHRISRSGLLQRARKMDTTFDMAALQRNQCGFGSGAADPERFEKARSLAAFVRIPILLGLFPLEDVSGERFWWVLSRYDNSVVGMGDQVFSSEEEADAHMKKQSGLLNTEEQNIVICSSVEESLQWLKPQLHVDIVSLLRRRGRIIALTVPVSRRKKRMILYGAITAVLAGGVWGAMNWHERETEKAMLESARQARTNKEAYRSGLLNRPEHHFKQTWVDAPLVTDVAESCLPVMFGLPVISKGWQMREATCAGRSVAVTWEFQPRASFLELPQGGSLKSQRSAVSRLPVRGPVNPRPRNNQAYPNLLSQEMATRNLYQLTQQYAARLRLTFSAPEKRVIDDVTIAAPWSRGDWHLDAISVAYLKDAKFWRTLAELPGFTLERVALKNHDSWSLHGNIFARTDVNPSSKKK
jgi:hypothetical protein